MNVQDTNNPLLDNLTDAWKTVVEVQQHFNDIEMRIRALCLTLLSTLFGAASYFYHQSTTAGGFNPLITPYLLAIALAIVLLFWFMDVCWYHVFLRGSVDAGERLEKKMQDEGFPLDLTRSISQRSEQGRVLSWTSSARGNVFYGVLALVSFAGIVLTRVRGALIWAGVILLFVCATAVLFSMLWVPKAPQKVRCANCGSEEDPASGAFCTGCHSKRSRRVTNAPLFWLATVVGIALVLILGGTAILIPQRDASSEYQIRTSMAERLNYDIDSVSRQMGTGEIATLAVADNPIAVTFLYTIPEVKFRRLSWPAQQALVSENGWFVQDTQLAWQRFHKGLFCSAEDEKRMDITIVLSTQQLIKHFEIPLEHCWSAWKPSWRQITLQRADATLMLSAPDLK